MAPNASALLGLLLALGSAALYGVNIVSTRLAAAEGVSGVTVVFYRSFVMLGLVAAALVVGPAFEGLDRRGLVLALVASVATTVQFFAATRCKRTGVVAKVLWIHVLVLPASAAIGMLAGSLDPPQALLLAPLAVTVTVVCYVFGFALQFLALARTSAVVAGIAFCFEPVMATLSSVLFLGERLAALQILRGTPVLPAIVANVLLQQR